MPSAHTSCVAAVAFVFGSHLQLTPARGLVVSASASVLEGLEFNSRPDLTKAMLIGTVAFLPGVQCADVLQGTQPEHKTNRVK